MQIGENFYTQRLIDSIGVWIVGLESYPGWKEWNRRKIEMTFFSEIYSDSHTSGPNEFLLSKEIELQHAVALQFMGLQQTLESLKDCEFYFRRYPFQGLPITHSDHLRNICEMYFSRFYEFKERLKKYLNAMNLAAKNSKVNIGDLIKQFDKIFGEELKARNSIHHHQRFDDLAIDKLYMFHTLSSGIESESWKAERRSQYRSAAREWVKRVRIRSTHIAGFLEVTAKATLEICTFFPEKDNVVN